MYHLQWIFLGLLVALVACMQMFMVRRHRYVKDQVRALDETLRNQYEAREARFRQSGAYEADRGDISEPSPQEARAQEVHCTLQPTWRSISVEESVNEDLSFVPCEASPGNDPHEVLDIVSLDNGKFENGARKQVEDSHVACRPDPCRFTYGRRNAMDVAKSAIEHVHERHNTEKIPVRVLQAFMFFICYLLARYALELFEYNSFDKLHGWTEGLAFSSALIALLIALNLFIPRQVPLFLAHMALPPYVDYDNLQNLLCVLAGQQNSVESCLSCA